MSSSLLSHGLAVNSPSPFSAGNSNDRKGLLVAGGTPSWFQALRDALLSLRPNWTLDHVLEVHSVRNNLNSHRHDAVIGAGSCQAMLEEAAIRFPNIPRIAVQTESGDVNHVTAFGGAHFSITTDPGETPSQTAYNLITAISIQEWTAQPSLRKLLSEIKTLPILPRLHAQISRELQSPDSSLETVSQLVRQDPVMAAKFLQVINSAAFGLAHTVIDPAEAVMFLGIERTRALVLAAGVFSQFDALRCADFSPDQVWEHSLRVGDLAQQIALLQTRQSKLAEAAFTAGLLHDIGKLVLVGNLPEMYATAHRLQRNKNIQQVEAEAEMLSTTHAILGACLLGAWKLPLNIVEAVAWHHKPSISPDKEFTVLTAVHVANVLAHERAEANIDVAVPSRFDIFYLATLGLARRRNSWREACGLPAKDDQDGLEQHAHRELEAKKAPTTNAAPAWSL